MKYIELPIACDALTVVVSKENTLVDHLTVAELKKMWEPAAQGKVMNWNQIRVELPRRAADARRARARTPARSTTSPKPIVGKAKVVAGRLPGERGRQRHRAVRVAQQGALGYFGLAYYEENTDKLRRSRSWRPTPSPAVRRRSQTVTTARYQPLSRPLFIYVKAKSTEAPRGQAVRRLLPRGGAALAKEVGYIDLPEAAYELATQNFAAGKLGTGFGGTPEVGLQVEDLLKREGKL